MIIESCAVNFSSQVTRPPLLECQLQQQVCSNAIRVVLLSMTISLFIETRSVFLER